VLLPSALVVPTHQVRAGFLSLSVLLLSARLFFEFGEFFLSFAVTFVSQDMRFFSFGALIVLTESVTCWLQA
jgi:hypothetical protein